MEFLFVYLTMCLFEQVESWIKSAEKMLLMVTSVPNSFEEAERLQKDHQQFENAIEVGSDVFKVSNQVWFSWVLFLF